MKVELPYIEAKDLLRTHINMMAALAEEKLPLGWTIELRFNQVEATMELVDPNGDDFELDCDESHFLGMIEAAIEADPMYQIKI